MLKHMTFKERVLACVKKLPRGKVVSYGQVAAAAGSPRAARQVGWIMHTLDGQSQIPWWRAVNNKGYLSIRGNEISTKNLQKKLLEKESIIVDKDFNLDMKKYRYNKV